MPTRKTPFRTRLGRCSCAIRRHMTDALGDYDEAVRLDPGNAAHYRGRGQVWHWKKEHDKAIADYSEAIKLDPKSAPAFIGRGAAWAGKKNYTMPSPIIAKPSGLIRSQSLPMKTAGSPGRRRESSPRRSWTTLRS